MSWLYDWWIDLAKLLGLPESFQYPFVARGVVAILMALLQMHPAPEGAKPL